MRKGNGKEFFFCHFHGVLKFDILLVALAWATVVWTFRI